MEERRVRFKTGDRLDKKTGIVIGEGSKGYAAIPDGTHIVLNFRHGEVEILPENPPPSFGEIRYQQS